ncbi:hypothetical protein BJX63DRAFT_432957 [Aspergillus granulosus]|uniref:Uncharacterized protein n=1 Tax=Aspergillus granulosus TaxID=176169 RepID=A0ABR4H976_9EURO
MACTHLSSSMSAQQYRTEWLYQGPLDDEAAVGIRTCDANGSLVRFITRTILTPDNETFYLLGHVFSGTVTENLKVGTHEHGRRSRNDGWVTNTSIISGTTTLPAQGTSAGNLVAIKGE